MKSVALYECEICGRRHATETDAIACEARGLEDVDGIAVGDIVLVRAGYHWYDGDRAWIANFDALGGAPRRTESHGNCFGACCTFDFYYVVTAITREPADPHRTRYHVASKACAQEQRGAWTGLRHYLPRKVVDPPRAVVESSRDLIGRCSNHLL